MFYAPFVERLRLYLSTGTRTSTLYHIFSNMTSNAAPTDIELPTMRNATASNEPDGEFDTKSAPQTMGSTSQVDPTPRPLQSLPILTRRRLRHLQSCQLKIG